MWKGRRKENWLDDWKEQIYPQDTMKRDTEYLCPNGEVG